MLTFIDSNVLIAAATGRGRHAILALTILSDPTRKFASSPFIRLETLPKAMFHRQKLEADFYEDYFQSVQVWNEDVAAIVAEAEKVCCQFGLNMADGLHIAAALQAGAVELITAERPQSPFKNVKGIHIHSIYTT